MKTLIINADDYGLTGGCNRAIDDAMQAGAVTSTSVMVWSQASIRNTELPATGGVHLRLTDGRPVLPVFMVRSLVDEDGSFPNSQQAVAMRNPNQDEVYAEWSAQVLAYLQAGGVLTHLDTHRHTHALLNLQDVYQRLCREFQVAGVPLSWRQREYLRSGGVPCVDFTEIRWTDGSIGTLLALLDEDFQKHNSVHLMCHPGYNDKELEAASTMNKVRQAELEVLTAPKLREWCARKQITLASYDDIALSPDPLDKVDILFLAWNRRRFTEESLLALERNTDWSRVARLYLYDDGSTDGTKQLLNAFRGRLPNVEICWLETNYRSPVAIMNDYLQRDPAPWFAKIDNDTVVPPGWLADCIQVLRMNPDIDFLGIEPKYPLPVDQPIGRTPGTCEPTDHIGGIGFMRSAAFEELPVAAGRMGFSDWQIHHDVNKAWLNPAIPVILLDRLPFEPWASLSEEYEGKGWQRPWKRYTDQDWRLWEWWKTK